VTQRAAALLRERADLYGQDAHRMRQQGQTDDATFLEAIRDELRLVARQIEAA
jgi:hypothetical protein